MNYSIEKIRELESLPIAKLLEASKNADKPDRFNYAFAACCSACLNGIGLKPFDEQIMAAWALYNGKVIEMKTGEGKTISAVFAAFLYVLDGHSVHVLTYNDYLVRRDFNWMKPIYNLLGIDAAHITEDTSKNERKEAYSHQVVYNTAKECGFDFLRDFVNDGDVLQGKLDVAIIDEADSILIDEARIPLVIAGSVPITQAEPHSNKYTENELGDTFDFIKTLSKNDYGVSAETKSAFLNESGIEKAERFFGTDLYDDKNQSLLSVINDSLKAYFILIENVNYIVKDEEILIIDEFTGRTAKNRRYPGSLQNAVEFKHGIKSEYRGVIMGTVPIQYFIRQYEHLSGMTGTVFPSEEEFELLYDLKPEKIPPHVPSKRTDRPMEIYYNKALKFEAIKRDIIRAHEKGQPVLIGAQSIEESETLAAALRGAGVNVTVLNAKNDENEAGIIKNAGALNTVTISANMAGRGVDILLGGHDRSTRDRVVNSGGLYAVSTSMRESSRINRQLRGRTGRQGDIGESKVFCALDDEIMIKYNLKKLIPKKRYPDYTEEIITDKTVIREAERIQRISEGDRLDERKRLLKFSAISEKHRDAIFKARKKFVTGESVPSFWQDNSPDEYEIAIDKFGQEKVDNLQRKLILSVINEAWSDYLEFTSSLREGIHLTSVGGKNPAEEFNITSQRYYESIEERVISDMSDALETLIELDKTDDFVIMKPENVYTYLQNESADELVKKPILLQAVEGAKLIDEDDIAFPLDIEERGNAMTAEMPLSAAIGGEQTCNKEEKPQEKSKGFFRKFFS